MKITIAWLALLLLLSGCKPEAQKNTMDFFETKPPKNRVEGKGFSIPVYDFEGLEALFHQGDEYTYVINFWATWCAPCIAELPFFVRLGTAYQDEMVRVVLVNLDMAKMWETHLVPFLEKREMKSYVVVLQDPKQNSWIPKVYKDWSGAIPATLIYNSGLRKFYEKPFSYEELQSELNNFLKTKTHENPDHTTDNRSGTPGTGIQPPAAGNS